MTDFDYWCSHFKDRSNFFHALSRQEFEHYGEALRIAAAQLGLKMFELDCNYLVTNASAMDCFASVFGFPEWFGKNWDAVFDLLTDSSLIESPGCIVVLNNEEELWRAEEAEIEHLAEVLSAAALFWQNGEGAPPEGDAWVLFHVVCVGIRNEHPVLEKIKQAVCKHSCE